MLDYMAQLNAAGEKRKTNNQLEGCLDRRAVLRTKRRSNPAPGGQKGLVTRSQGTWNGGLTQARKW